MNCNSGSLIPPDSAARHIGIAADHGGYELKEYLLKMLRAAAHEVTDFEVRLFMLKN
jgi:hypothetical protein